MHNLRKKTLALCIASLYKLQIFGIRDLLKLLYVLIFIDRCWSKINAELRSHYNIPETIHISFSTYCAFEWISKAHPPHVKAHLPISFSFTMKKIVIISTYTSFFRDESNLKNFVLFMVTKINLIIVIGIYLYEAAELINTQKLICTHRM